ncbi:DNA ligase 1 isoform X3 [Magallana gigas]|uniref:DNA ligase 1 isoform X3 n=1 Tax=Magallana gigas TaxID=29159 RepID=UPI00334011DB
MAIQMTSSSQSQYHNRSLASTPVKTYSDTSSKDRRHVRFSNSEIKNNHLQIDSIKHHHKESSLENHESKSKMISDLESQNVFSSSRNDSLMNKSSKLGFGSASPDSGVASGGSGSKSGSDPPSNQSESGTPRYKFHSTYHTPDSGLLLGGINRSSNKQTKYRNSSFSFAAKSSILADEVEDLLEDENVKDKHTLPKTGVQIPISRREHGLHRETRRIAFEPKPNHHLPQKKERASPRIAEIVESPKKSSDPVKLPPTKQNGHLVHSDDPEQTRKSKKTEEHDGRQLADPKRKKKRKKKSTKEQAEKVSENDKKGRKQEAESPTRFSKSQTEKQKSTQQSQNSQKARPGDERQESPTRHSPTGHDKSRPVTKNNRSEHNPAADSDDKVFSPVSKYDEVLMNEQKREEQLMKLRLPKKTRYGPVRSKGLQTPRTPRSKTPRSRTPGNQNFIKLTGYSHSDVGDYRRPVRRKSILNNKDTVLLENSRPKSYKWEGDKSIYRVETKEWEDQRDETTWRPSVNSPTDWLKVYVGDIQIREKSAKSRRSSPETAGRNVRPGAPQRNSNEYILTRRQVPVYKNMQSAYNTKLVKDKQSREKRFFQKLQECQALKAKMQISELVERQQKREITKQRQQGQLKELRQRFEDAAWVRFNTQYVTSRILEHEKMNRYAYGLPEEVDGAPEFESKLKRKPPKIKVDFGKLEKTNKKKYGSMFSIYKGPEWDPLAKTPPMEGIDTVEIGYETEEEYTPNDVEENDGGNKKVKTRRVKDVIREAEKEVADLKAKETSTGFTPRASESNNKTTNGLDLDSDDDDDDMSDIFERARKKYNLEIDDETMSRSRK